MLTLERFSAPFQKPLVDAISCRPTNDFTN